MHHDCIPSHFENRTTCQAFASAFFPQESKWVLTAITFDLCAVQHFFPFRYWRKHDRSTIRFMWYQIQVATWHYAKHKMLEFWMIEAKIFQWLHWDSSFPIWLRWMKINLSLWLKVSERIIVLFFLDLIKKRSYLWQPWFSPNFTLDLPCRAGISHHKHS